MVRMAEGDIKKYIEPLKKEIENIFNSWLRRPFWCVHVNACVERADMMCVVLSTQSVQMFPCRSSLTGWGGGSYICFAVSSADG